MVPGTGVELQGRRAGLPRFARVLTTPGLAVVIHGRLGEPGDAVELRVDAEQLAAAAIDAARRDGLRRVTRQQFAATAADRDALGAAFEARWAASWADQIADLRARVAADPGPGVVLVLRHWAAQTTAQPWGPALAELTAGRVRAIDSAADVALLAAGPRVAAWLRGYYGGPALPPPAELTDAAGSDTPDTYRMALGLWQPQLTGPLEKLRQALHTARTVLG